MKTTCLSALGSTKKQYESPKMEFIRLQTEHGIAAGSVQTTNTGSLKDEWETENHQTDISW